MGQAVMLMPIFRHLSIAVGTPVTTDPTALAHHSPFIVYLFQTRVVSVDKQMKLMKIEWQQLWLL